MWLVLGGLVGCGSLGGGPCDRSALSKAVMAVASQRADSRPDIAALAIAETCTGLDPELRTALQDLPSAPPGLRSAMEMKAIAEHPQWWTAACPEGTQVLADSVAVRPGDRGALLHTRCGLDALEFSPADLGGRGYPLMAVVVRRALRDAGAPDFDGTQVTRMLAGG